MCEGFYLKTEKYIYSVKKLSVCCSLCVEEGCVFGRSVFVVLIQVVSTYIAYLGPLCVYIEFVFSTCNLENERDNNALHFTESPGIYFKKGIDPLVR